MKKKLKRFILTTKWEGIITFIFSLFFLIACFIDLRHLCIYQIFSDWGLSRLKAYPMIALKCNFDL